MASRERTPGTLPPPGPIGRVARLALGLVTAGVVVAVLLARLDGPPGHTNPSPLFLLVVVIAVHLVGDIVELGFRRRWGAVSRAAAVSLAGALAVVDVVAYDRWWAPALAWYLFLLVEVTFGFLAVSLVTAAAIAAPG